MTARLNAEPQHAYCCASTWLFWARNSPRDSARGSTTTGSRPARSGLTASVERPAAGGLPATGAPPRCRCGGTDDERAVDEAAAEPGEPEPAAARGPPPTSHAPMRGEVRVWVTELALAAAGPPCARKDCTGRARAEGDGDRDEECAAAAAAASTDDALTPAGCSTWSGMRPCRRSTSVSSASSCPPTPATTRLATEADAEETALAVADPLVIPPGAGGAAAAAAGTTADGKAAPPGAPRSRCWPSAAMARGVGSSNTATVAAPAPLCRPMGSASAAEPAGPSQLADPSQTNAWCCACCSCCRGGVRMGMPVNALRVTLLLLPSGSESELDMPAEAEGRDGRRRMPWLPCLMPVEAVAGDLLLEPP